MKAKRTFVLAVAATLLICASLSMTCGSSGDTAKPILSDIEATEVTATSAAIGWTTNEDATSEVDYGTSDDYGSTLNQDPPSATSHAVVLNGLTPNTNYHYRVRSADESGNVSVSTDHSFTTTGTMAIISVDLVGEVVTLLYEGPEMWINLEGWRLVSTVGGEEYTFPYYGMIPGPELDVTSGSTALYDPPDSIVWADEDIWEDSGDPAELYDAEGNLVSTYP
jgi:hypothetical protein